MHACRRPGNSLLQVHLLGHSLGAAAAIQLSYALAREGMAVGSLVLSAPFLSVPHMAKLILGGALPPALRPLLSPLLQIFVPHRWDNASLLPMAAKAGWRIAIVHGSMDTM